MYINYTVIKTWASSVAVLTFYWSTYGSHAESLARNIFGFLPLPPPTIVYKPYRSMTDSEMHTVSGSICSMCSGGRHSVNASISMPIPEVALHVNEHLPPITEMHTSDRDLEKSGDSEILKAASDFAPETLDIEHVTVQNDPRKWSSFRKVSFLPSWVLYLFYYPLSYIAFYPGINLFCIFGRWTCVQYTEPWVIWSTSLITAQASFRYTQLRSLRWKQNYQQPLRNSAWAFRSLFSSKAWCRFSGVH